MPRLKCLCLADLLATFSAFPPPTFAHLLDVVFFFKMIWLFLWHIKCSMSGTFYPGDIFFRGRFIQGTFYSGYVLSRGHLIQGTFYPGDVSWQETSHESFFIRWRLVYANFVSGRFDLKVMFCEERFRGWGRRGTFRKWIWLRGWGGGGGCVVYYCMLYVLVQYMYKILLIRER